MTVATTTMITGRCRSNSARNDRRPAAAHDVEPDAEDAGGDGQRQRACHRVDRARHGALRQPDDVAGHAVDQGRQAERRLHQQVEGETGEEPDDGAVVRAARPCPPTMATSSKTSAATPCDPQLREQRPAASTAAETARMMRDPRRRLFIAGGLPQHDVTKVRS